MRLYYVTVYTGLGGGGCPCCEAGCADATCCTSCSELFGSLPSELAIFFLLFIFILACVGAMVAVFVGTLYIGRVISSHVHLLQKESLARDYIVADLDDIGTSSNGSWSGSGSGNMLSDVDEIGMTSLSPIHCIEAPIGSSSPASSSHQQDDNSGYISIHTDQIAITYPPERQREREHQSGTASGDSTIMYSSIRRRSEANRTLSEAQKRELTALGLM